MVHKIIGSGGIILLIACAAAGSVISIPAVQGQPGSVVVVPVNIDVGALTGVLAIDLQIAYDTTILELSNADCKVAGLMASGWALTPNVIDANGTVTIGLFSVDPLVGSPGQILELDFHIPALVTSGSSPISVAANINEQAVTTTSGQVTVVPEPTTMCLLILGWVACRLKRK